MFSADARSVTSGSRGFFVRAFWYAGDWRARIARLTVLYQLVRLKIMQAMLTSEHVLPLLVVHDSPGLQLLSLEPVCDSERLRLGRAWLNGLLLLLLLLCLLLRPHLRLLLCHGLLTESLYVFLDGDAVLLCLCRELLLDLPYLLRCRLLAVRSLDVDRNALGWTLGGRGPFLRRWPTLGSCSFGAHCAWYLISTW